MRTYFDIFTNDHPRQDDESLASYLERFWDWMLAQGGLSPDAAVRLRAEVQRLKDERDETAQQVASLKAVPTDERLAELIEATIDAGTNQEMLRELLADTQRHALAQARSLAALQGQAEKADELAATCKLQFTGIDEVTANAGEMSGVGYQIDGVADIGRAQRIALTAIRTAYEALDSVKGE